MTSKQVMLVLSLLAVVGCQYLPGLRPQTLHSPYQTRRIWAVAPLRNESGSAQADALALADRLAEQIQLVEGIDALPVNRVLAAMQLMQISQVATPAQARALLAALGADGLIVADVQAYDPYDPPKIGLALELYTQPAVEQHELDLRRLMLAATEDAAQPTQTQPTFVPQPVSTVSGLWLASDPAVRQQLNDYACRRGPESPGQEGWRRYRTNMSLYSEFVARAAIAKLIAAENQRLNLANPRTEPRLASRP